MLTNPQFPAEKETHCNPRIKMRKLQQAWYFWNELKVEQTMQKESFTMTLCSKTLKRPTYMS